MRALGVGLALALTACAEPQTSAPESTPAPPPVADPVPATTPETPPARVPSLLPPLPEGASVRLHRYDPVAIRAREEAEPPCEIERSPDRFPIPTDMERAFLSPDGTVEVFTDDGFRGSDHDVFDQVTAIVEGEGRRIILRAPDEDIRITSRTDQEYGISLFAGRDPSGERVVRCDYALPFPSAYKQARFQVGVLDGDVPDETETVFGYGGSHEGCLTIQDIARSAQYLAVFSEAPDGGRLYRRFHDRGSCPELPLASHILWTRCRPDPVEGVRVALPAPVCGSLTEAILLDPASADALLKR